MLTPYLQKLKPKRLVEAARSWRNWDNLGSGVWNNFTTRKCTYIYIYIYVLYRIYMIYIEFIYIYIHDIYIYNI